MAASDCLVVLSARDDRWGDDQREMGDRKDTWAMTVRRNLAPCTPAQMGETNAPIPNSDAPAARRIEPGPPIRNAAINTAGFIIRVVATLIMAPAMLRNLGDERYGTWLAISDLTGYYGLLDIGVRGAVSYYVARFQSKGQWDELEKTVRACFWLLSGLGTALILICVPFCMVVPRFFRIGSIPTTETVPASIIITIAVGLNLPFSVASAILNGVRRIDLASGIEVVLRSLGTCLTYYAVTSGCTLVTLAAINASTSAVVWIATWAKVRSVGAGVNLWPPGFEWSRIKDALRFGSASFFLNVSMQVISNLQVLMIAAVLGVGLVAPFNLANSSVVYYHYLITTIALTFTTAFTHLHAAGKQTELTAFFCNGSRYTGALAAVGAVGLAVYGSAFLRLWVGERFVTGDPRFRADYILFVLLVATVPRTFQGIGFQYLLATRQMRFLTTMRGIEAAGNLVLTLVLIRPAGLVGVAVGVMMPMFISNAGFMLRYTLRTIGMTWREYWSSVLRGPLILGIWALICAMLVSRWLPPQSWRTLAANAAAVILLSFPVFLKSIASPEDTHAVVSRLRSILRGSQAPS